MRKLNRALVCIITVFYEKAKKNLGGGNIADIPGDLAILAIRRMELSDNSFPELIAQLAGHHPDLVPDAKRAERVIAFQKLEENRNRNLPHRPRTRGPVYTQRRLGLGSIPFSPIRWEMTGYDDEIKKLW